MHSEVQSQAAWLTLRRNSDDDVKEQFDAAPGQHIRLRTANVPGKGYAMWAIFVGAALMWTAVEREEDGPLDIDPVLQPFVH